MGQYGFKHIIADFFWPILNYIYLEDIWLQQDGTTSDLQRQPTSPELNDEFLVK